MDWLEALEIAVLRYGHKRYRQLCADEHPDHVAWRRKMIEKATGQSAPLRSVDDILAEAKAEGIPARIAQSRPCGGC